MDCGVVDLRGDTVADKHASQYGQSALKVTSAFVSCRVRGDQISPRLPCTASTWSERDPELARSKSQH